MLRLMMAASSHGPAQLIHYDPSRLATGVILSDGDKVATNSGYSSHRYAAMTLPKMNGAWQYELIVEQMSAASSGNILFGIMPAGSSTGNTYPGFSGGCGLWTRQNAAASRFYSGSSESTYTSLPAVGGNIISPGDVCGLTVDFSSKLVSVYKNGALIHSATVPEIDTGANDYVPAIKIWGSLANPTVVRIPASLSHNVPGYLPW